MSNTLLPHLLLSATVAMSPLLRLGDALFSEPPETAPSAPCSSHAARLVPVDRSALPATPPARYPIHAAPGHRQATAPALSPFRQPAIVRRPDALRRYDVWLPMNTGAPYWLRVGLFGPQWDNPVHTLCSGWNSLPIQSLTVGLVRPGRISTTLNGRLAESAGWHDGTNLGYCSGLFYRLSAALNSYVRCRVPPGHDHVSVIFKQIPAPYGGIITTSLDGDVIDSDYDTSFAGQTGYWRVHERVIAVLPSFTSRTLQVTLTGVSGGRLLCLIAIQSWSSTATADPREVDPDDGLWLGNRLIETYNSCYGGLAVYFPHLPNTFSDCDYLCTPNTVDMVFSQNNGSGPLKFTGYGFHYGGVDTDAPFTPTALPSLSIDGGAPVNMAATPAGGDEMQYGDVLLGNAITTSCTGTCGPGGATSVTFTQVFAESGISLPTSVRFSNAAAVGVVYLPTLSGSDRTMTLGLPELTYAVTIPPASQAYVFPPAVTFAVPAMSIDIARADAPWIVRQTAPEGAVLLGVTGVAKVYLKHALAGLPAPANGVVWQLDGGLSVFDAVCLHNLEIDVIGRGSVACAPPGGAFPFGTMVQLTAHPAAGWHFDRWSGGLTASTNPTSVVMSGHKVVTAVFGLIGDVNCDGEVGFSDINPFVQYLSDFPAWQATYPGCPARNGDINGDGTYGEASFGDINPFATLLSGR